MTVTSTSRCSFERLLGKYPPLEQDGPTLSALMRFLLLKLEGNGQLVIPSPDSNKPEGLDCAQSLAWDYFRGSHGERARAMVKITTIREDFRRFLPELRRHAGLDPAEPVLGEFFSLLEQTLQDIRSDVPDRQTVEDALLGLAERLIELYVS